MTGVRAKIMRPATPACAWVLAMVLGGMSLLLVASDAGAGPVRLAMETSAGVMEIELDPDRAPETVANFLSYAKSGFYDGTIFHRTIYDWIIQGGGYDRELKEREAGSPVKNEADNGLKNVRGTIAMARLSDPDSADSQFFINLSDNPALDHAARSRRGWGYCVFGRVVKGMDVADAIGAMETQEVPGFGANVPVDPVVIERVMILE